MGFPDGGVGDMSSMRAADLIWQLQSVVNSDLVAEDAKLDLVADYGSDQTVSHHGKWSRSSSKSDLLRSAKIRRAFADALGKVTGCHVVESAGNAKLGDIIGMLTANKKPLTKREVRKVLSNAGKFIDFGALRKALAADRKSCEKLPSQGDALMAKIGDFEQKVQRSKASFSKAEIDGFAAKYAEAQKLSRPEAEKIEQSIPKEIRDQLAVRKEDYQSTMAAVQLKKEQFLAQYRAAYPKAAKDIKFEDAVKALNEQKIDVPESLKDVDKMTLQQLKDKLTALEYDDVSELYPSKAWQDDMEAQESALTDLIRQKTLQQIAETTEKAVQELESSIPENVRKAIADGTEIKPDLDQFLKTEPDGEGVDSAVGGEAVKLRSELLTEIETLKTELGKWSASLKKANAEAGRLVDMDPGDGGRSYASDCEKCQKSLQRQGDALKTLQKKLDDLQSRYDATFVAPKKAAEETKKPEPKIIKEEKKEKIIEKPKEEKIVGQDKPKAAVQKPIVVKLGDLVPGNKKLTAATIRDNVRKLLKVSIPDFDQWVATLKDGFIKDLKLSDVSAKYFEGIWKDDLVVRNILGGQGGGSQDNIGAKVVDILKKHAENKECQINPDEFKQELRQKLLAGYQDSYKKEHWGQINAAQENLTTLASTPDFIKDLGEKFQNWKKDALLPLKSCLASAKFQLVEKKAAEAFKNFMEGIGNGKLLDVKDKTLFNHLIESLAPSAKNSQPNVDSVLLYSLDQLVKGYGLVNGFDGTSKPNLDLQVRIEQKDGESPHEVIQKLLNQELGKGLVQKGGYSCWMISIVNGLLNSEKGREVLGKCFAKKDEYVFPALDKEAKTIPITVKLDDVRKLLKANPKAGISQLEAAIWLGVETMKKNPNIYSSTAGCALGQMGEASEVATLFGLQGQSDENGKSSGDDSQIRWADGANALHEGRIVVLHRGPPGEIETGHFMAVVGSQLDQNNDNAQSFDICDSLSAGITTNVGAGMLVTPFVVGSDKLLCNTVMVYDFPPAS